MRLFLVSSLNAQKTSSWHALYCGSMALMHDFEVTFLLAKLFSDLDNPDCLDFRASRNKNLK